MKIRIIKADFWLLLNQASLLSGGSFPVTAAAFPCSAFLFPCSAFSVPCYRITAKTLFKLLIEKDNKSNKSPQNREEKFSFPVLSLFRPINRERRPHPQLAEILRHSDIVYDGPKSRFAQRRKGAKSMSGRYALCSYGLYRARRDEEERRTLLPRHIFAPLRPCANQRLAPRRAILDVNRRDSSISPTDTKASHFESFPSAGFDPPARQATPARSASFIDIVKMVPIPAEERPGWMH
ncbi:MAG: hypothetical protein ABIO86_15110 [Sphingomonas sp.]